MPIFDVKCSNCGAEKEVILRLSEEVTGCECGGEFRKQVGKMNFELKGKGWFKDGYK